MRLTRLDRETASAPLTSSDAIVVLGRQPGRGLKIDDATVSREHAKLFQRNGKWHVADLGSSNGTFVNGAKVTHAEIHPGDVLKLGSVELRFDDGGEAEAHAPAPPVVVDAPMPNSPEETGIQLELPTDFFSAAPKQDAPRAAAAAAAPAGPAFTPQRSKALERALAERAARAAKPDGSPLLRQDLAQHGGLSKALLVGIALAVAAGLFFGVMKLTETVVPEQTVPADGAEVPPAAEDDGG